MQSRTLDIPGMYNVRDLGGLPTQSGGQTRSGWFVRGDSPHAIDAGAQQRFLDYGIHTVIDLRYAQERQLMPNPLAQHASIDYHAVPLFVGGVVVDRPELLNMDVFYQHLLRTAQVEIAQVCTQMAESTGAVFFHCRAGKDRTGIIAALLLDLVDVEHEAIVQDFVATEHNIQGLLPALRAHRPAQLSAEQYELLLDAKRHYIEAALTLITHEYGHSRAYLRHIGVDEAHIDTLVHRLSS